MTTGEDQGATSPPDWSTLSWQRLEATNLEVSERELILTFGTMKLWQQPWKNEHNEGLAWLVQLPRSSSFGRVLHGDEVKPLESFAAADNGSWALINGGFYERTSPDDATFRPMGVVRTASSTRSDYTHRGGSGIFLIKERPEVPHFDIVHRSQWEVLPREEITDALQSIDRLVDQGEVLVKPKPMARQTARSAVALNEQDVWLVVVAGKGSLRPFSRGFRLRGTSYHGMTLEEFASFVKATTGASEALNLDGSVSTQLTVKTPERSFEVLGERGTINALELRPKRR